jgi:hypothetical protein
MKRTVVIVALLMSFCAGLDAYVFLGQTWPAGSIPMHLALGSSGGALIDGSTSWGQSAEAALATWNPYLRSVQFSVIRDSTAARADGNGVNNVFWSSSIFGRSFGSTTLAVTTNWSRGSTRVEADVIFNTAFSFNSYAGSLGRTASGANLYDFRRVALHEFGHVLGLGHPDQAGQSVNSIMQSSTSNIDRLQPDDIAGVSALYGGATAPPPTGSAPGAPNSLTAAASSSFVSLSWRAPTTGGSPTRYVVEAGSVSGSANLANASTGSTATTFTASNIGAGVYYVRVRAANSAGVSAASNEAVLIVGSSACSSAPTAPTSLVGSAGGTTVTLAWTAPGGNPTSYIVEGGSGPGLSNLANSDTGSAVPSLTAPGVGPGVYYVRVRGKNACGVGPVSNEVVVIVR